MLELIQQLLLLFQIGLDGFLHQSVVSLHRFHELLVHHLHELQLFLPDHGPHFIKALLNYLLYAVGFVLAGVDVTRCHFVAL